MTEEEIKQYAKEYADKKIPKEEMPIRWSEHYKSFIAGANLIHSQLAEKDKQINNLQIMLQAEREVRCNEDYLKKVTELEAQIEKMKCCDNCDYASGLFNTCIQNCIRRNKWKMKEWQK